jgi:hypothetical protein
MGRYRSMPRHGHACAVCSGYVIAVDASFDSADSTKKSSPAHSARCAGRILSALIRKVTVIASRAADSPTK